MVLFRIDDLSKLVKLTLHLPTIYPIYHSCPVDAVKCGVLCPTPPRPGLGVRILCTLSSSRSHSTVPTARTIPRKKLPAYIEATDAASLHERSPIAVQAFSQPAYIIWGIAPEYSARARGLQICRRQFWDCRAMSHLRAKIANDAMRRLPRNRR